MYELKKSLEVILKSQGFKESKYEADTLIYIYDEDIEKTGEVLNWRISIKFGLDIFVEILLNGEYEASEEFRYSKIREILNFINHYLEENNNDK